MWYIKSIVHQHKSINTYKQINYYGLCGVILDSFLPLMLTPFSIGQQIWSPPTNTKLHNCSSLATKVPAIALVPFNMPTQRPGFSWRKANQTMPLLHSIASTGLHFTQRESQRSRNALFLTSWDTFHDTVPHSVHLATWTLLNCKYDRQVHGLWFCSLCLECIDSQISTKFNFSTTSCLCSYVIL